MSFPICTVQTSQTRPRHWDEQAALCHARAGVPSLLLTSAMGLACYLTIAAYAKPVYDEQGHLLDGGGDLSKGQVCAEPAHSPLLCPCLCLCSSLVKGQGLTPSQLIPRCIHHPPPLPLAKRGCKHSKVQKGDAHGELHRQREP